MAGMSQPPAYQPQTDFSTEERDNVGGRSTVRTAALDTEFDNVAATLSAVRANMALNQRDDGEIRDGRVKLFTLASDVLALLTSYGATPRGAWATATQYNVKDLVTQGGNTYLAVVAHVAGVFAADLAAGKWLLFSLGSAPGASQVTFTPTVGVSATNVQAAIEELDAEYRAAVAAEDSAIRSDLLNQLVVSKGAGMLGVASNVDYPAGTVGERFKDEIAITEPRFGGLQAGSWHAAFAAAKAYADSKVNPGDANGPYAGPELTIPNAALPLTADVAMPRRVRALGNLTGAFRATWTQIKRAVVDGLTSAGSMRFDGLWFSRVSGLQGNVELRGGGTGFGAFWNYFQNITGDVAIDVSNWSVNQNVFVNGRGKVTISGGPAGALDCHQNVFFCWDFTPGAVGYLDTSSTQQTNLMFAAYYEAGATIKGPAHIFGFHGDDGGPPMVGRDNWAIGSSNVIERNRADFIPAGAHNLLQGGEWDLLDAAGRPLCLTSTGGNTITADANEPSGMKYRYGGAFTAAFSGFQITLPPCPSGTFSMALYYRGDDFAAVTVGRGGGGTTTSGGASFKVVDPANGWKLMRISGDASKTAATTVSLFAFQGVGGSKNIAIGGMFASQEKAALLPSAKANRTQTGTATQGYVSGGPSVDISITFPRPFAAGSTPSIQQPAVVLSQPQSPNYTKVAVLNVTNLGFTARVFYATDWAGQLLWTASGLD
jgi:hypothetical protein